MLMTLNDRFVRADRFDSSLLGDRLFGNNYFSDILLPTRRKGNTIAVCKSPIEYGHIYTRQSVDNTHKTIGLMNTVKPI